ncbi:MAG TPA: hypothetical protein VIG48_12350 [Jatrophihabitans sp.]
MRSTTYDPAGTVLDGIAAYEQAAGGSRAADTRARYRRLADDVRSAMHPGDTCELAFAAELDRPDGERGTAPAFVAVLDDRVLVAWRRGRLRHRSGTVVVSRASILAVRVRAGAVEPKEILLTIAGDKDVVLVAGAGTHSVLHDVLSRTATPTTTAPDRARQAW